MKSTTTEVMIHKLIWMLKILILVLHLLLRKKKLIQRGKGKQNNVALSSTQPVLSTNVNDN